MLRWLKRWFCRHTNIDDTMLWDSDHEELRSVCRDCGLEVAPPDRWVEMAERRQLKPVARSGEPTHAGKV